MNKTDIKHIFLIMNIFIAACIETDIYLPAFADMMKYFSASEQSIQSLLTWNFIGLCVSGPFYGPLSDSYGRKKPLLLALGLFLIGSFFTLFAQDFQMMLFGRVLQGLGSGGCFTLGTAIIFDVFHKEKAIQALNIMNSTVPFMMATAPMVGGYLNHVYGFRSNFLVITLFVLFSFLICAFFFKEPLPSNKRTPFSYKKVAKDFRRVFVCIPFWQLTFVISFLFAGYLTFLSGIAVLYVVEFGVSKAWFPLYQGAMLLAYLIASLTCTPFIHRWGIGKLKLLGAIAAILGALSFLIISFMTPEHPVLLTLTMLPFAFGFIWTQTPYVSELMEILPDIKGIAASLLTSTRLLITASMVGLASLLYNGTIYPLVFVVLLTVVIVIPLLLCCERASKENFFSSR